jgi:23S rRNA pseudouridine2457 synthase
MGELDFAGINAVYPKWVCAFMEDDLSFFIHGAHFSCINQFKIVSIGFAKDGREPVFALLASYVMKWCSHGNLAKVLIYGPITKVKGLVALKYYLIYKPYEVLTRFSREGDKAILSDFFDVPTDVYPVGRLDYDSEGLLLLTNDKSLNHRLLSPQFAHEREYWVQVDGAVTDQAIAELQRGVEITVDGKKYHTKRCIAEIFAEEPVLPPRNPPIRFRKSIPAPWIKLILHEGKNRQVRKMTAAVGFPTLRLVRYRIGKIALEGLQPGEMVEMTQEEVYRKVLGVSR